MNSNSAKFQPAVRPEAADQLRMLARLAVALALVFAILWGWQLDWSRGSPRDGTGLIVGRDFLSFWTAGKAAWDPGPARFYDFATYQAEIAPLVGPDYPGQVWSYPPSMMLLAWPLKFLPYFAALALWTVIGPMLFLLTVSRWNRDWSLLVAAVLCPAALFGLVSGQIAFLATAVILAALRFRNTRPWLAGALLGLLTIKPQLGLFFPLLLLAERNWRVIGIATVWAVAITALTTLIWGTEVWTAYLTEGIANHSSVLAQAKPIIAPFMPTVLMNLRGAGVPLPVAEIVQAAASLFAAGLILWHFRHARPEDDWRGNAGFLAAATFGAPYMLSYDTLALVTAMLLAVVSQPVPRLLVLGCWLLSSLQLVLGQAGLPGSALLPLVTALILLRRSASDTVKQQTSA